MTKYKFVELLIDEQIINSNDIFRIIEPLWWSVSIYDGEDQYYQDLSEFSDAQRYIFAIEWYISEVNNGGHDQFYFNSTGIVWEDALKGFDVIGSQVNYEIIKESAFRLGGNPSKDREERQDQLENYDADFDDLDNKFYDSEAILGDKILEYIRANSKQFFFKGIVKIPE